MSLVDEQWEFLQDVAKLIQYIGTFPDHKASGGELWRHPEWQAICVQQKKSKTLKSQHIEKLAIDINLFVKGVYVTNKEGHAKIGAYWKSLNPKNRWGGDWGWDANHYEREI